MHPVPFELSWYPQANHFSGDMMGIVKAEISVVDFLDYFNPTLYQCLRD